jgi:hypothetical protein
MEQRVLFQKGEQRNFLNSIKSNLRCVSLRSISQFGIEVNYSTLKNYYCEATLMPRNLFEDLCHLAKINSSQLNVRFLEGNWGCVKAGKKGMDALIKKYPDKLKEWRKKGMKNSPVIGKANLKKIKIPEINEQLAEFIGVYLGDGTLTEYQIRISGDYRYDLPYYVYLSKTILELFEVYASVHKEKNRNTSLLLISSKNICSFLNEKFKIKYGNKIRNKTIIPKQILNDEKLSIACLRGLIDTDGYIGRRGRNGSQFCIQFGSHNKYLLRQVYDIGKKLGIFTFCDKLGCGTNKWENIEKYFNIVGSSNLRHIVRFHLRKFENKTIYQREVLNYYDKKVYKDLKLPFKISGA